jgi:serine/threonine protein kinase
VPNRADVSTEEPSGFHPPSEAGPRKKFAPGAELGGRFILNRSLGAGGMGEVFAAFDRVRQSEVAVKLLGAWAPRSIADLKREFRAAAELVHPNLVRLHELCADGADWYFSMDLVEGVQLPELLARGSSPSLLRHVFRQLAAGLRALHRADTLHADLKPSNFLIAAPNHDVVLLDFGLARPIGLTEGTPGAGTPAYMAPEQALGEPLTEAADWYSFGVVLYEALTGSLPLWRPSVDRLNGAPDDLKRLCLDILVLDPKARPSGEEVLRRIGDSSSGGVLSSIPAVSGRALIGRKSELIELESALQTTLHGEPAIVLIEGPSGIGKTALVRHYLRHLENRRTFVLAGACRERESMSYKAVDGLIDGIVALLDGLPRAEAEALLPAGIADLTVLFPALRAAQAVAGVEEVVPSSSDQGQLRLRAIDAFRELIARLRKLRPLVLAIDDLQWSDSESALLLGPVLGSSERVPLLLIGTTRGNPDEPGPLLAALQAERGDALPKPVSVRLGPLAEADAASLALQILSPGTEDPADAARSIGREAGGHPLFIAELAHAASEPEVGGVGAPRSFAELITHRLANLPRAASALLGIVAVGGTPLPRRILRLAVGLSAVETEQAIDVLKASRLARSRGLRDDDLVESHHDRVREIVVQTLDDAVRRRCHSSLARALETWREGKPELVALHYEGAGELESAGRHWLVAADHAARALAFNHAAELYARALELASLTSIEQRAVEVRRAEALGHAGNGPAAADAYLAAAGTAALGEALDLKRRAAEQLLLSGHLDRGLAVMQEVLGAVGIRKRLTGPPSLTAVIVGRLRLKMRGLDHTSRAESLLSQETLARIDACWTLACSLGVIDPIRGADFQALHLRLALTAGEPRRTLRALTLEASYTSTAGLGAQRHTARVLALADELASNASDPVAQGLLRVAHGVAAYLEGRNETALSELGLALEVLTRKCPGAVWETVTAQRFTIASLFWLGRFKRLGEVVPPLLAEADGTGNLYATMCFRTAYSWAAWLARGDVAEAAEQTRLASSEWKASGYQLSHCNVLISQSYIDLYAAENERAYLHLLEEWPRLEASNYLRIGVLRAQLWKLRAVTALATADELQARGQGARASELRHDARVQAKRLRGEPFGRAQAFAAVVEAALARSAGDSVNTRRGLERALTLFEQQQMTLFAAAADSHLGMLIGGSEGAARVDRARAAFTREDVAEPAKMMRMLVPGFG